MREKQKRVTAVAAGSAERRGGIEDAVQKIANAFGVNITDVRASYSGARSLVYRANSDVGELCVREIRNVTSKRGLNFSQRLQRRLSENGFPYVSVPLKASAGRIVKDQDGSPMPYVTDVDGVYYSVSPWINGEKFGGSEREIFGAGKFLAEYHSVSTRILVDSIESGKTDYSGIGGTWGTILNDFPPEGDCEKTPLAALNDTQRPADAISDKKRRKPWSLLEFREIARKGASVVDDLVLAGAPIVESASKMIRDRLHNMGFRIGYDSDGKVRDVVFPIPKTIVHGDYTPENVLFSSGEPIGLIDFDLTGTRERVSDIAWGMFTFSARDSRINDAKAAKFLAGYRKVSPISDLEAHLIPLELMGRLIGTTHWLSSRHFNEGVDLHEPEIKKNVGLLRQNLGILDWIVKNPDFLAGG